MSLNLSLTANGQSKSRVKFLQTWADQIQVDGNLDDWDLSAFSVYKEQDLTFNLSNDQNHLYFAIRVADQERQVRLLSQGISLTINTDGKKRPGLSIRYPVADRLALRELLSPDNDHGPEDFRLAALEAVRGIYITGFEHLLDGMLSLNNQYGILGRAQVDEEDALCIEFQIPIKHLHLTQAQETAELAYNLILGPGLPASGKETTVNDGNRNQNIGFPGYYPGYGYYPYGGMHTMPTRSRQDTGIWGKFKLAPSSNQQFK
jgi:hypothetical protein